MILDFFGMYIYILLSFFIYICLAFDILLAVPAGFHITTEASLGVVATCLGAGVLLSLLKKSE